MSTRKVGKVVGWKSLTLAQIPRKNVESTLENVVVRITSAIWEEHVTLLVDCRHVQTKAQNVEYNVPGLMLLWDLQVIEQ